MKDLKRLLKAAMLPHRNVDVNFAQEDLQEAAKNALAKHFKVKADMSVRDLRKVLDMGIIEEVVDEVLPAALEDVLGQWAEIKTFGRDEEVKFTLKNVGKNRAMLSIVPGSRGGVYKARRLDDKNVFIDTKVYTVGTFITLEEILLGKVSLSELMDNILTGITFEIFKNVVAALRTAKTLAPAANIDSAQGVSASALDGLIRVAGQYGTPVIVTFQGIASKISNEQGSSNPNVAVGDVDDIRNKGYVTIYKGTPVIRIPNFLTDESNADWVFSEADAFILPTEGKLVKIALKGDGYSKETPHPSGSVEQNYHRIMGTGIVMYNNICVYTDTDIASAESGKELV